MKVPAAELVTRLKRFSNMMDLSYESWTYVFLFNPVNIFYFTGTMQDGVLFIKNGEQPEYFVRRSVERAKEESRFSNIVPIESFSEIAQKLIISKYSKIFIDKKSVTIDFFERFNKHFSFENIGSCDKELELCRAKKSVYELGMIRRAGEIQRQVFEEYMPEVLKPGMTEAEAAALMLGEFIRQGAQGISRVRAFGREIVVGCVCFGINSLKKFAFDGPGGIEGNCPAAPVLGSPNRILEPEDLIFIDACCGVEGYMTDMTTLYSFRTVPDYIYDQQRRCRNIRDRAAEMLRPGVTPQKIYRDAINSLHPALEGLFMGITPYSSKFIGHGIGLYVDEYPAIANGFTEPLEENMVIALEPKAGIKSFGTIGVENTYIVTPSGGESVNGDNGEIIKLRL